MPAERKKLMGDGMRALKVATAVMGVLIVVGTIGLLVAMARRGASPPAAVAAGPAGSAWGVTLAEPEGTRVVGIAAVQDRVALQLQGGGLDRVVLVDPRTGAVTGRISLAR
jgi:NADPH-dependent curcumin reductase CurA